MLVKPISAPPVTASVTVSAVSVDLSAFKPLRLNFAQVCVYCGTRWCQSARCVQLHAASVWVPCLDCDGFGPMVDCARCTYGVVEVTGSDTSDQARRILPNDPPENWPEYTVSPDADLF